MEKADNKECLICKCELPSDYKIPLCRYHRDRCGDYAKVGGLSVLGAGASVFVLAKTHSLDRAKDVFYQIRSINE